MEEKERQRAVHWEDERDGTAPRRDRVLFDRPASRRRRDGALSAAATLSLYLSDALRDSERRPRPQRRPADPQSSITALKQSAIASNDMAANDPATQPDSPMARFLHRRIQRDGRLLMPEAKARESHTETTRALRLSSVSSASMERLLREKINEAKRIRDRPSRGVENQSPNRRHEAPVGDSVTDEKGAESPQRSSDVPMPHPKPHQPPLQLKASCSTDDKPHQVTTNKCSRLKKERLDNVTTAAVCKVQHWWRRVAKRRQQVAVERRSTNTLENELSTEADDDNVETDANFDAASIDLIQSDLADNSNAHADDDEATDRDVPETTLIEAAIQTENSGANEHEVTELTEEPRPQVHSIQTVMWQDDEWSFLEEGRYAANELLDSAAHVQDLSIEALVWTKPHVVVEIQEAKRRAIERARRTAAKKTKRSTTTTAATNSTKEKEMVRIPLQLTKLRRRRRVTVKGLRVGCVRAESRSNPVEGLSPAATDAFGDEAAGLCEQDAPNDDVYATMLTQLHRYVVFSDAPLVAENDDSSITRKNDLIAVHSNTSSASRASFASEHDEVDAIDSAASDSVVGVHDDCLLGDTASTTERLQLPEVPEVPTGTSIFPPDEPTDLFPTLDHVEHVVERTLARIHSVHASSLQVVPPPSSPSPSPSVTSSSSLFDAATQREFRDALSAFQQSLHASRASNDIAPLVVDASAVSEDDESSDGGVDAELELMLQEIQRCKQQIALARRQSTPMQPLDLDAGFRTPS